MMYFEKIETIEALRTEFKRLAFILHPDSGGNTKQFQEMQNQFETKLKQLDKNQTNQEQKTRFETEYEMNLMNVVSKLIHLDFLTLELCGSWLWVFGCERKNKELQTILKENKLRFHVKKSCWYFCDFENSKKTFKTKELDMNEIRLKHGSKILNDKTKVKNK